MTNFDPRVLGIPCHFSLCPLLSGSGRMALVLAWGVSLTKSTGDHLLLWWNFTAGMCPSPSSELNLQFGS